MNQNNVNSIDNGLKTKSEVVGEGTVSATDTSSPLDRNVTLLLISASLVAVSLVSVLLCFSKKVNSFNGISECRRWILSMKLIFFICQDGNNKYFVNFYHRIILISISVLYK